MNTRLFTLVLLLLVVALVASLGGVNTVAAGELPLSWFDGR